MHTGTLRSQKKKTKLMNMLMQYFGSPGELSIQTMLRNKTRHGLAMNLHEFERTDIEHHQQ